MADFPGPSTDKDPTIRHRFNELPLHRALGIQLVESRPGFARIVIHTSPTTMGGVQGSVHGGVTAAMIDIACLAALSPMRQPGDIYNGTADLNITYLRPCLGAQLFAEATVIRKGRSLAVTEVSILDAEGRLCAKGRTIYALAREPGYQAGAR